MTEKPSPENDQILKAIQGRRSVRKFDSCPVERSKILTCINAARLAPSAENIQPWRFVIVDEEKSLQDLHLAAFTGIYKATRWAEKAPVIVAITANINIIAHQMGGGLQKIPFHFVDVGIAGEHFVLQAESLGLGTCWIGWFHVKRTTKLLGIPPSNKLCGLLAVGYPDKQLQPKRKRLKSLEDIVFVNRWGNSLKKEDEYPK